MNKLEQLVLAQLQFSILVLYLCLYSTVQSDVRQQGGLESKIGADF